MPSYRVLIINRDDRIRAFNSCECATDESAKTEAAALLSWHPAVEVWHGERFVGRLEVYAASPMECADDAEAMIEGEVGNCDRPVRATRQSEARQCP